MYKKIINFVIIGLPFFLQANTIENPSSLKIRSAGFIPASKLFREIYQTAAACLELEYAFKFRDYLEIWGNFDWLFKEHGRSVGLCNPTTITIANFSFGLKFPYRFTTCNEIYIGIGPSIAGVWLNNKSYCSCENISKAAGGIVVKTGYSHYFSKSIFFDFFADYIYQPARLQHKTDIGGVRIGAGVGGTF